VVSTLVAGLLALFTGRDLSLRKLRTIEIISFGAIIIQVSLMSWLRIEDSVLSGELGEALLASQFIYTLFCLVILAYGIFIPNNWRRAAAVLLPVSVIPIVIMTALPWFSPETQILNEEGQLTKPIPETVVAAMIAIFGSHVIQGARREAFKAKQLGQYTLNDLIGVGGMGEVYSAEHRMLKRPCAIKLIHAESDSSEKAITCFEQEVQATAKLSHWNSVDVYDYGRTDDGTFYYVMELLPGATLEQIITKTGPMPTSRAIHFLVQICDALNEAHSLGLVHRDIKPPNIFASTRGGIHDVAKLLDFGLVRQSSDTLDGQAGFAGTPAYMSPEQATSYESVDGRGDIYSLGAVAFYLVTGRPPFESESVAGLLLCHRKEPVPSIQSLNASVDEDFQMIVSKCLAKNPVDRYQVVSELGEALRKCKSASDWSPKQADLWWEGHADFSFQSNRETEPLATQTMPISRNV
ncbi:MAG: serine/threonine-protein kinase, partial [Planctomycetota bacterium]